MNIQDFFDRIPDFRRKQGLRTTLADAMWMIVLGIASGYDGYRSIGTFVKTNKAFFAQSLQLKHDVPSYVTIREIIRNIDKKALLDAFNEWSGGATMQNGEWVAGDGKSLAATVSNTFTDEQDFVSTISLFSQRTGLTCRLAEYRNKSQSETQAMRHLLPSIKGKGLIVTLDAIHTQKKQ